MSSRIWAVATYFPMKLWNFISTVLWPCTAPEPYYLAFFRYNCSLYYSQLKAADFGHGHFSFCRCTFSTLPPMWYFSFAQLFPSFNLCTSHRKLLQWTQKDYHLLAFFVLALLFIVIPVMCWPKTTRQTRNKPQTSHAAFLEKKPSPKDAGSLLICVAYKGYTHFLPGKKL